MSQTSAEEVERGGRVGDPTAGLLTLPAIGVEIDVSNRRVQPKIATVRVDHVNEGSITLVQSLLRRVRTDQGQRRVQGWRTYKF